MAVSRGDEPADLQIRGGQVVDVYSGRVRPATIGIAEGRIAWIGDLREDALETMDVDGAVVAPGLIEPHGHPDILYTPSAYATALALTGTTAVSVEAHVLLLWSDDRAFFEIVEGLADATTKLFWRLRPERDGVEDDSGEAIARAARMLGELPEAVGVGEITGWSQLGRGSGALEELIDATLTHRLRADAHAPGASLRTLQLLAAAGLTSDHEAIDGRQLTDALTSGFWVMLRNSSLRPDANDLARTLVEQGANLDRVMLTTDGLVAADIETAGLDAVVRGLIASGIDPLVAIRMATLAPASYLGLDAHVGGISPGRSADFVVVDSLDSFTVQAVIADGERVTDATVRGGSIDWSRFDAHGFALANVDASELEATALGGPSVRFDGIITRRAPRSDGDTLALLVDRNGRWITGLTIADLPVHALASSHTEGGDVLLVGKDATVLLGLYRRIVEAGGGAATANHFLPLDAMGYMYDGSIGELAQRVASLTEDAPLGPGLPPFEFLTLFLTTASLPELRLTSSGIVDVKLRSVVTEARPTGLAVR